MSPENLNKTITMLKIILEQVISASDNTTKNSPQRLNQRSFKKIILSSFPEYENEMSAISIMLDCFNLIGNACRSKEEGKSTTGLTVFLAGLGIILLVASLYLYFCKSSSGEQIDDIPIESKISLQR